MEQVYKSDEIVVRRTEKLCFAYKKVVTRVIVRTTSKVMGESCYFHPFLKRYVIAKLMIKPSTLICENLRTREIRVESAFVCEIEDPKWTPEERQEFKNMEAKGYNVKIRTTSILDLCCYYDLESEVKPFKSFNMDTSLSGISSGIYAFWDEKSARDFNMDNHAPKKKMTSDDLLINSSLCI